MGIFKFGFLPPRGSETAYSERTLGSTMSTNTTSEESRTRRLATWATHLTYDDLPTDVVERTKELFLDYLACGIAGRHHPAVTAIAKFARKMGPSTGDAELTNKSLGTSSPAFAGLVNGAASHVVEQDDLHNNSIVHPATVIFPAALAVAQDVHTTGQEFIVACVVGYDVACRTGAYLGRTHYKNFHSTATAGVIGVAAAVGRLLKLNVEQMVSAIGTAGTQAAGLWQFLVCASHSKQVHTGKACFDGIFAAYTAKDNLLGPREVLEGAHGMGAVLVPGAPNPSALDDRLGQKFSVLESSFKWHASCRHTHPSADALLNVLNNHDIAFDDIESVVARTYQAAIDVLSMSERAETVHQSKFSMGFVLAVVAKYRRATINDFTEEALQDQDLRQFQKRVVMEFDPAIDAKFPDEWQGIVIVKTKSGQEFTEFVDVVKGDPGLSLTRGELASKVMTLAEYGRIEDLNPVRDTIQRVWNLEKETDLRGFQY